MQVLSRELEIIRECLREHPFDVAAGDIAFGSPLRKVFAVRRIQRERVNSPQLPIQEELRQMIQRPFDW